MPKEELKKHIGEFDDIRSTRILIVKISRNSYAKWLYYQANPS